MMRSRSGAHADVIGNLVRRHGREPPIPDVVRSSWSRCLDSYALDPGETRRPTSVDGVDLQARRERLGVLLAIARFEMEALGKLIQDSEYSIMLTDRDGVILSYIGDSGFSATARSCGFREGVMWGEREMGTNGMGTCLTARRPVVIHRMDHFLAQNTQLTCSAAPIFDMRGELLAALDISGASFNPQSHTLALVEMAAQNVENRTLLSACRDLHVVRFHRCAEFVSTPGEGVLAFDDQGVITGANRAALALLGQRDHGSVCGQRVDRVLDTSVASVLRLAGQGGFPAQALNCRTSERRWFAAVHAPGSQPSRAQLVTGAGAAADAARPAATRASLECLYSTDPIVTHNVEVLQRVLDRDISVLLLGETGTGKGYCARAVHGASNRADKPFVTVNCAAIPEALIESELFGHKPGAFTGASREGGMGRILQANGGTLFLDEIGDMPVALQSRLLNVIEDREVLPLGGNKVVSVDVRVISATQHNPLDMIATGQFREDLYYRLNGITVRLPPLRQRTDIADLMHKLLSKEAGTGLTVAIEPALIERLVHHSWPGNVRQLRNVLRTMLALRTSERLTLAEFNEEWLAYGATEQLAGEPEHASEDREDVLGEAEREALCRVLESCQWNVSAAAARLQISRRTIYRKIHRHGLLRHAPHLGAGCEPE
ncbi:MAG TPA: sigma-54-dependent Fis family transcriptional regulator [Steroidobacteraceae bacterium]|jgi:transcriptional regulator of acetoin/glycerol metabolism|nr:sigma-54-dependent Fis family transcriptional regulator [Steroidobacteraceae bacterium]